MVRTRRGQASSAAAQPAAAAQHTLLLDVDVLDLVLKRLPQQDALGLLSTQTAYRRTHAMLCRFIAIYSGRSDGESSHPGWKEAQGDARGPARGRRDPARHP